MSKKVFIVLLLAVFMLAQFGIASAATAAGDAVITSAPDFSNDVTADLDWAVTGMAGPTQNILMWSRIQQTPAVAYSGCYLVATIVGTSDASGTFSYTMPVAANGNVVEFIVTVDDNDCAGAPTIPADTETPMAETFIDLVSVEGDYFNPPSLDTTDFNSTPVSCNTFEMWGVMSDKVTVPAGVAYSGFDSWNLSTTGTFVPAPIGSDNALLSWVFTFPSTASGPWIFEFNPTDAAGNDWGPAPYPMFRDGVAPVDVVSAAELEDCANFSDVTGHEYEVYIRYLADLDLISGFADGTFGPDNTLTRAEASTLFEISNGYTAATLPASAPAGCAFTDVSASDWFAGWVWQACADGFMNGVGGGLFDPNNLLTRGQVVTIFNNIFEMGGGTGGYLDFAMVSTALSQDWTSWENPYLREAAWTDVSVGAYYAIPVLRAYGIGVAEGTSATTFSPDQAATRGEFAKMLYRAISQQ
ncbi:S-layer homology domain-containing protein [Candidatus Villigracilis affinis]|uniref:S-layer homology domain-containing protein n=1 Tax=Candidatus Villigracilis affinis TaxID=3140682 RepID=UPI002A1C8B98|nr:S-layer homology domain-containing protein [Anaerolineales bacterium]